MRASLTQRDGSGDRSEEMPRTSASDIDPHTPHKDESKDGVFRADLHIVSYMSSM